MSPRDERETVIAEVVGLCVNPVGKHPLSNRSAADRLAGLNTVEVLGKKQRVVYAARIAGGVGLVEVIRAGPRTGNAVYDVASALVRSGELTEDEVTQIWDALALLDVVAETVGIDGWVYVPRPAEPHLVRALVQLGLLSADIAAVVSRDEADAAMRDGYDDAGQPDPAAALIAVLRAARTRSDYGDATDILRRRRESRCGAEMPRPRHLHPPHRASRPAPRNWVTAPRGNRCLPSPDNLFPAARFRAILVDLSNNGRLVKTVTIYRLPYGEVFSTRHSARDCWAVAQSGLILLSEIGSTMHGVSSDDTGDDLDLMGICVEPPVEVLGLGDFEQYEYRDRRVNERSQEGDTDLVVYGFGKWVRLAAAGNPTVLMLLFSDPDRHVKWANEFGLRLREEFPRFLSRQAGHKFLGYLDGQLQRYLDCGRVDSKHATRPELVEKYGWDTKTGYHALRLAIQGKQLMDYQRIDLPMREDDRAFLLDVRHGKYTREWVIEETHRRIGLLEAAIATSRLPEKSNRDEISVWMAAFGRAWWEHNGL